MKQVVVETYAKRYAGYVPAVRKLVLALMRATRTEGHVEIFLVTDAWMEKNVLAFPPPEGFPRPDLEAQPLGELYLNPGYIAKHGEDMRSMVIHGFLHLLGYDHKRQVDYQKMEKREKVLLEKTAAVRFNK
jgi:rRNA maturation RNase YbeY